MQVRVAEAQANAASDRAHLEQRASELSAELGAAQAAAAEERGSLAALISQLEGQLAGASSAAAGSAEDAAAQKQAGLMACTSGDGAPCKAHRTVHGGSMMTHLRSPCIVQARLFMPP